MRDLPHRDSVRAGSARSVAVQDRRQAGGKVDGFHYSAGFAKADFVRDDTRLDAWLANPQTIIPGAIMAYRQPKAETRTAIIAISRS
jgi:cytochrome c2